MIETITGLVKETRDCCVVLDIGVLSFSLLVPNAAFMQKQQPATLYVYMHWNQENGPTLYGFNTDVERSLFLMIISCSGIGPKIAVAVLQVLSPQEFIGAIQTDDVKSLSKINGIGAKKAEQIIVQLRHKVDKLLDKNMHLTSDQYRNYKDITDALGSLYYSRQEIQAAIQHLKTESNQMPFDQLLRKALVFLSKKT